MNSKALKYTIPFIVYAVAIIAFTNAGFLCWLALIYAWILILLAELFIKPVVANMEAAEEELAKKISCMIGSFI